MEPLLEPISAAAPAGEDLSYDIIMNDLAVMIQGTPDNQFEEGSAKEPSWPPVRKMAEDGLKRSKDLQLAVYYTLALSQTNGMEGAARGMELIAGITRQYWDTLFPNLDPDDNDPTQRVNILSQLTVEPGSYGDPVQFINRLYAASVFRSPGVGPVSIDAVTKEGGFGAARLPEIAAGANPEEVANGVAALGRVLAAVHAIDDFLVDTLGRGRAASFDPLIKALDKGKRLFETLIPAVSAADEAAGMEATGDAADGAGSATATATKKDSITGEIHSADDVRKTIKKICDYYAANEPSSPVPILMQRALKLVGMDFLSLLDNLTSTGKSALADIIGPET